MNLLLDFDNDYKPEILFGFEEARSRIAKGKWVCEIVKGETFLYRFFVMKSFRIYEIIIPKDAKCMTGQDRLCIYIDNFIEAEYNGFNNWCISDEKRVFGEAELNKIESDEKGYTKI